MLRKYANPAVLFDENPQSYFPVKARSQMDDDAKFQLPVILDLTLDVENYHEGALEMLRHVRPEWTEDKTGVKVFSNGITNKMLGYYHCDDKTDIVLIRINGNKTEIFLDRSKEVENFKTLHKAGRAPNLYCIFNNGLCYEYINGETITRDDVRNPEIFKLIAEEMVKLHRVKLPQLQQSNLIRPEVFSLSEKFLNLIFSPDAPPGRSLDRYTGPTEEKLRKELQILEDHLSKLGSPLVYCHNDLLLNNIIYNKEKQSVSFIDYEYTGVNHQAFDIGNHFCEFAGVDDVDYSLYPGRELQLSWIHEYLRHWNDGAEVLDKDVEALYVVVNKFSMAANFMWGMWALVQAKYSSIEFDYFGYASERLGEYYGRKEEFLSLRMP